MSELYIILGCLVQIAIYIGIYGFIVSRYKIQGLLTPLRVFAFYLCTGPGIGLLSNELITPYSMTKMSVILISDFILALS